MKTQFKRLLIAALLFSMSACEKEPTKPVEQPIVLQPQWQLSIEIPEYDFGYTGVEVDINTLVGAHDDSIGSAIRFECDYPFVAQIMWNDSGYVQQFTGTIDGHPFIVHNGLMNVCNGPQQIEFIYDLKPL